MTALATIQPQDEQAVRNTLAVLSDANGLTIKTDADNLLPYSCANCGKPADLADGNPDWAADGDRDVRFWATGCCWGEFIDRHGVEYLGGSPFAEVD